MKTVKDRVETIRCPIFNCEENDKICVWIDKPVKVTLRNAELVKIKPIAKGWYQIKYRNHGWNGKPGTIQKVDLPGSIIVERTRVYRPRDVT